MFPGLSSQGWGGLHVTTLPLQPTSFHDSVSVSTQVGFMSPSKSLTRFSLSLQSTWAVFTDSPCLYCFAPCLLLGPAVSQAPGLCAFGHAPCLWLQTHSPLSKSPAFLPVLSAVPPAAMVLRGQGQWPPLSWGLRPMGSPGNQNRKHSKKTANQNRVHLGWYQYAVRELHVNVINP